MNKYILIGTLVSSLICPLKVLADPILPPNTISAPLVVPPAIPNLNTPTSSLKPTTEYDVEIDDNKIITLDGSEVGKTAIPGVKITLSDGEDSFQDLDFKPVKKVYMNTGGISDIRMSKGSQSTSFSIDIIPPDNTEIKAEAIPDKKPDGTNSKIFVLNRKFVKIKQGDYYSFRFTAIGSQSGTLNFYNRNKERVASTRYKIAPYKHLNQSLNVGVTSNINVIGGDFDSGPDVNLNYSRSGDAWSSSLGISGGPSGASVNANFSWNW